MFLVVLPRWLRSATLPLALGQLEVLAPLRHSLGYFLALSALQLQDNLLGRFCLQKKMQPKTQRVPDRGKNQSVAAADKYQE